MHKLGCQGLLTRSEKEAYINLFPARIDNWSVVNGKSGKMWKIIRADGTFEFYRDMKEMVKSCDREDLNTLWQTVQLDFKAGRNFDVKAQELVADLQRMFAPNSVDVYWSVSSQEQITSWQLYTKSGVHHLTIKGGVDLFMLTDKVYPLSPDVLYGMMTSKLQCEEQTDAANTLLLSIGGQLLSKICEDLNHDSKTQKRRRV